MTKLGHTIYCPEEVVARNKGATPLTYQKFLSLVSAMARPPQPLAAPGSLPGAGEEGDKEHRVPSLQELGVKEEVSQALTVELGPAPACTYTCLTVGRVSVPWRGGCRPPEDGGEGLHVQGSLGQVGAQSSF